MPDNKKTCLYDKHVALGAQMSPFGGFEMPIQYRGIVEEHEAVRNACGVFDVSHMGEVTIEGPAAEAYVNYVFSNDVTDAPVGKCFYGMMLNPSGGVVDDLLVYKRAADKFFFVINASNIDKDVEWIKSNASGFDVTVENVSENLGELAVQGPAAERIMNEVLGIDCSQLTFYTFFETIIDGQPSIVSRTGYTGEDGFEIYASHQVIIDLWERLIASGQVEPCGLGCRDTLRFEVGLPLYGNELADDISPLEAGLSMFVRMEKPDFIGRDATVALKAKGVDRKLVGLELADRAIPRHGYEVLNDADEVVGHVTTGYHSISTDKSVANAMVDVRYSALGTPLKVRIRRKTFPAAVVKKKYYKKNYKN